LEKQINVFANSSDPSLGLVYTNYGTINEFGDEIYNTGFKLRSDVAGYDYDKLCYGNLVAGSASSVLIKKKYFDLVGVFDESLICSEDWDMWLRLSEVCTFAFTPDILVYLRRHPNNIQKYREKMVRGELLVLNKLFKSGNLPFVRLYELKEQFFLLDNHLKNIFEFKHCHPFIKEYLIHTEKLTKEQRKASELPLLTFTIFFNYSKACSYVKHLLLKTKILSPRLKEELLWLSNSLKNPVNLLIRIRNLLKKLKR
jgi:hypothetical protein